MKGDFTRVRFEPAKHYSSVRMQQGRVQLDSDWNEQLDIVAHHDRIEAVDVIGACGVPKKGGGFLIGLTPDNSDLTISPGRIYVDGILVEWNPAEVPVETVAGDVLTLPYLSADGKAFAQDEWIEVLHDGGTVQTRIASVDTSARTLTATPSLPSLTGQVRVRRLATYFNQPFYPGASIVETEGNYVVYLDVWERHVTALEDPDIREIALGGPDTTTRTQIVWQVKVLHIDNFEGVLSCDNVPDWQALLPQNGGLLTARTHPEEVPTDPCQSPAGAGYRLLENQLYRVEIHRVNSDGSATFKWSRDNGSVVTSWTDKINDNLQVSSLGRDAVLGFYGQTYAELTDDSHELAETPGTIVRVTPSATEDNMLTIDTSLTIVGSTDIAQFPLHPKIRRWESQGELDVEKPGTNDGFIALEGGVEVRFEMNAPYRIGDYWTIPARAAIGEQGGDILWPSDAADPNLPLPQSAQGITHHYCLLAVIPVGATPQDCRPDFPSLTEICAEDVCFNNEICDLPDAKTVQDVLDYLCQGSDLRFHNKHLHGWGVVCGLQVACESDQTVRVRSGYAIDCEGRDLRVNDDEILDINQLAAASGLNPPTTDGTDHFFLRIDSAVGGVSFVLEPPSTGKKSALEELLQDTLLFDFFNDCIRPLIVAAQEILNADTGVAAGIVTGREQRLISLLNLFVQLVQRTYGSHVYLSRKEHDILQKIYDEFVGVLHSETFCMLLDSLTPIPDYPFDEVRQDTIFGRGFHRRLRLHPEGTIGYTVGYNNQIHIYDLENRQLVNAVNFPASGDLVVQDVAISADGSHLFAVATSATDSYFVAGEINGFDIAWGNISQFSSVRLVTLEFYGTQRLRGAAAVGGRGETLVAIGKGKGIYGITANAVSGQFLLQTLFECAAVGHLQVRGLSILATASQQNDAYNYDSLVVYDSSLDGNQFQVIPLSNFAQQQPVTGQDDMILVVDNQRELTRLVIEVDSFGGNSNRHALLLGFDGATPFGMNVIDLGEPSPVHFAYDPITTDLIVAYEDSFRLGLMDLQEGALLDFEQPVQIDPLSMGFSRKLNEIYVLNAVSNTITTIDAQAFSIKATDDPSLHIDMGRLAEYRSQMLRAYLSLLAAVVQHVKDCFCDHLLVNCPECDEEDKVYLAEISTYNGRVRKVCNFSRRKQVKTFPKVDYWLSLFPVEALLDYAVEQVCCLVIPDLFTRIKTPSFTNIKGVTMRESVASFQRTSAQTIMQNLIRRVSPVGTMFQDTLSGIRREAARPDIQPAKPVIPGYSLVSQPLETAKAELEAANIEVTVQPYQPTAGVQNVANYVASLGRVAPGSRVTLFTDGNTVRTVAVESAPAASVAAAPETDSLRSEIVSLRAELDRINKANAEMVQQRDIQIKALQDQLATRQVISPAAPQVSGEETLKAVQDHDARINALFDSLTALQKQIDAQNQPKTTRKPKSASGTEEDKA